MSNYTVNKCDLCGKEIRSDRTGGHWTDVIRPVIIDLKHPATQIKREYDVCRDCVDRLRHGIEKIVDDIKASKRR